MAALPKLRGKQARFVQEYLKDLNGKQAAIRAGYSPRSAEVLASQTLRNPKVQAAIAAAQAARARRVHLTQDAVLEELKVLAFSDLSHYAIDEYGNVALREDAPPDAMRAVASLKKKIIHTDTAVLYETEIKLWNKPASVRMAGEHLGLLKGAEQVLPDIIVHVHEARSRLGARLAHLAQRQAEESTNGA
jgi:phage terminase small subunit